MKLETLNRHTSVDPAMSFSEKHEEMENLGAFAKIFGEGSPGATLTLLKMRMQKIFISMSPLERKMTLEMSPQPPKETNT